MEDATTDVAVAARLRTLCAIVTRVARSDLDARLSGSKAPIRAIDHGILRNLDEGPQTLSQLSERMSLSPSTLVSMIDRLESRDLLERTRHASDRRRQPITLTADGRALLDQTPAVEASSRLVHALAPLTHAERRQLAVLLDRWVDGLADDSLRRWLRPTPTQRRKVGSDDGTL